VDPSAEIVLTALTREAMPLSRYRTRDIASILDENLCECCGSHTKISRILGRTEDMESVAEKLRNQRMNMQCAYRFAMCETYLVLKTNDVTRTQRVLEGFG